jgi:hypothetical protein
MNGIRPEKLIPLDGNPVTIDVDVDAGLLLPFLIEQIADDYCDHEERTDYEVKAVTIHDQASQTVPRRAFLRQPSLLHRTRVQISVSPNIGTSIYARTRKVLLLLIDIVAW